MRSVSHFLFVYLRRYAYKHRIITNVKMQALVQVQRHTVLSIFDSLVALHRDGKTAFFLISAQEYSLEFISFKEHG